MEGLTVTDGAPEGQFRNCIVVEVGAWDIDGRSFPYIGIFNGRENVQIPLEKVGGEYIDLPDGLAFGSRVDIWCRISQGQKVVGERAIGKLQLRAVNVQHAGIANVTPLEDRIESYAA